MPKVAARIWLMVEEIRVERLQEISEEDAIAEGAKGYMNINDLNILSKAFKEFPDYNLPTPFQEHQFGYLSIWVQINGPESWLQNPWVWVVKFRVLSKTGRPSDEVILKYWKEVTHV